MSLFGSQSKIAAYRSVGAQGAVGGADPHALVLVLFNESMSRLAAAQSCLQRGDFVRKASLLHSTVILVAELRGSLDLQRGGSLAQNLNDLYDYVIRRLIYGNSANDPQALAECASLLGEIRSAWSAIGPEAVALGGSPGAPARSAIPQNAT